MGTRVLALAFVVACGGGGGHPRTTDGAPGGGDAPQGSACGANACDGACGSAIDACGNVVSCPRCKFDADAMPASNQGGMPYLVLGTTPSIGLAGQIWTKSTTWTSETVTPAGALVTGYVVAADGTRFVAYSGSETGVAHDDGSGGWTDEPRASYSAGDLALAIGGDGTVYAAWGGNDSQGHNGVILASRTPAGVWSAQTVMPTTTPEFVGVTVIANVPYVAWADDSDGSLEVATPSGATFAVETVDTNVPANVDHHLALVGDAAGNLHIAYRQDSPGFHEIDHAVKIGGTWHLDKAFVMQHGLQGGVRIAAAPNGDIAVAYETQGGIGLSTLHAGVWSMQPIAANDTGVTADIAYASDGTLDAAIVTWTGAQKLLVRDGLYPADYDATCAAVAASICPQACTCGSSDCCFTNSSGLHTCASPEAYCEQLTPWALCGDASQDPTAITTCAGMTTQLACTGGAAMLPAGCPYSY